MCCCSCDHASRAVYMILFYFAAPNISLFSHTLSPEIPSWLDETNIRRTKNPAFAYGKKRPVRFYYPLALSQNRVCFPLWCSNFLEFFVTQNSNFSLSKSRDWVRPFFNRNKRCRLPICSEHYYKTFFWNKNLKAPQLPHDYVEYVYTL
jgi:hypothetical protein